MLRAERRSSPRQRGACTRAAVQVAVSVRVFKNSESAASEFGRRRGVVFHPVNISSLCRAMPDPGVALCVKYLRWSSVYQQGHCSQLEGYPPRESYLEHMPVLAVATIVNLPAEYCRQNVSNTHFLKTTNKTTS